MARSRATIYAGLAAASIAAVAIGIGVRTATAPSPGSLAAIVQVQDFERGPSITKWPKDVRGEAALSREWKADGVYSLRIDPGVMAILDDLTRSDWTGYGVLRLRIHNPTGQTAPVGLEIQDGHAGFHERHQDSFGALPGEHTVEIDLSGGLWRGEENRAYRGKVKVPIDIAEITRLSFTNGGTGAIFLDAIQLVKVDPIATPGGFAFDFGKAGSRVMAQTIGVSEDAAYRPDRGHGYIGGPPTAIARSMAYPTPLLGDGLDLAGAGFRVDLSGGKTLGWIAFERGGFWEKQATGYRRAELLDNGVPVHTHDFTPPGPHFLFEDTEVTDPAQIEEKLVRPAHAIARFHFDAPAGDNTFTLKVEDPQGMPLRIAGLILAPDTPEGAAFVAAHEDLARKTMERAYAPLDRGRRGADRSAPSQDLLIEPRLPGSPMYPRDWPAGAAPLGVVAAVTGQPATLDLRLYATKPLRLEATATSLAGPEGASIPAPILRHGRYLPVRPYAVNPVWLEVHHYRPDPHFTVGPDLARSVLVEYTIPPNARPGVYEGVVALTGDERRDIPIRIEVHRVTLPPIPIPVGLLMNALPFGPEAVGEQTWWVYQRALLEEQARAGLSCVSGGPGLEYSYEAGGAPAFQGDPAVDYVRMASERGMTRSIVSYGGFLPRATPLAAIPDPVAFAKGWLAFAAERGLPPHSVAAYDEPGTDEEMRAATQRAASLSGAGLATLGFTSPRADALWKDLTDATSIVALSTHDAQALHSLKDRGKQVWVYNNGLDRYGMGLHLWRGLELGVQGRLEWIGLITQGFAFHELDGREPALAAWVVHDRFGPMPTPRWLSAREGLLDLRIRLALEAVVPANDPVLALWPLDGYGVDRGAWPDERLESVRAAMLRRLDELR